MEEFDVKRFSDIYSNMDAQKRNSFLQTLGRLFHIKDIECYSYPEAPGIKHVFFYFEGGKEAMPYFMLGKETLLQIQKLLDSIKQGQR